MDLGNISQVAEYALTQQMTQVQEQFGLGVLRKALDMQQSEASMLMQLLEQTPTSTDGHINLYA